MWRTHSCAVSLSFGGPCGARTPACRVHTRVNACLRHSMLLVAVKHKSCKMFAHKKTTSRLISTPSSGRSHECERGTQECVRHTIACATSCRNCDTMVSQQFIAAKLHGKSNIPRNSRVVSYVSRRQFIWRYPVGIRADPPRPPQQGSAGRHGGFYLA